LVQTLGVHGAVGSILRTTRTTTERRRRRTGDIPVELSRYCIYAADGIFLTLKALVVALIAPTALRTKPLRRFGESLA